MRRAASRRRASAASMWRRWSGGWRWCRSRWRCGVDGALQVWLPPVAGKEYLVAVDPAGGGADGDFAAVQVIEMESGLQCAELQQRLGTLELARVAARAGAGVWRGADGGGAE